MTQADIPMYDDGDNGNQCTAQDRINLTQWIQDTENSSVGGGISHYRKGGGLFGALDAYIQDSHSSFQHVADYVQDRSSYDYHYFVGVKIQATMDVLNHLQSPELQFLNMDQIKIIDCIKESLQHLLDALHDTQV